MAALIVASVLVAVGGVMMFVAGSGVVVLIVVTPAFAVPIVTSEGGHQLLRNQVLASLCRTQVA